MNRFLLSLGVLALSLSACSVGEAGNEAASAEAPLAGARIGGSFSLIDQNGKPFTDRELLGRYAIVYFGYSFCPDVCPVDLQNIGAGLKALEASDPALAAKVTPVFITIDPARDTPAVLKAYAAAFHPLMVALTGTPEQIAAAAKAYGIYYAKAPAAGSSEYLMDHSRQAYLFGPDGKPIALLPAEKSPQAVTAELKRWVK